MLCVLAHQADSLISFAFCLNQKKGLEKLTHTSLPYPPMAMRLSQWEKNFNTFGVFDTLGSEWEGMNGRRRGVENTEIPPWTLHLMFLIPSEMMNSTLGGNGREWRKGEVDMIYAC